ncbi:hypothetical protein Ahy_B07g086410 isoform A [Arachis hypogaea]|uniref:Uncharacterized protein n=1 Tax=Arachis hypogaea TaxID=3818 RepID=A0A444Y9P7_ARAHY|nr:hypothetical protein Ahy_B07g086410 isoform A [Arachis hypogaea]
MRLLPIVMELGRLLELVEFLRKFKASYLQKLIINIGNIGYVEGIRGWFVNTTCITNVYENGYALAFDGGYRWGHMTTNLVECINSVLKGARNFPVTALVKAIF